MLRDIQLEFVEAVLSGKFDALTPHISVLGSTAARRLSVYRNNTLSNLRNALRAVYPIVDQLVGTQFFNQTAKDFVAAQPSTSGDLNDYGGGFAAFLAAYPPVSELPYLPDVARVEWALEMAYYADDHPISEIQRLAEIPADSYGSLRMKLHPAITLLQSDFPLSEIWRVHQPDYEGDGTVDLDQGGDTLLITRRGLQTEMETLDPAAYTFLSQLFHGNSFLAAVTEALAIDEKFALQAFLVQRVMQGDIVDFISAD